MCVATARLKRPATNSDDQLSDSQQQSTAAQKKPRVFFSEQQKAALREAFQRDSYPNQPTLERLASELGVGTKTVVNWFHNHRMRAKQQQVRRLSFLSGSVSVCAWAVRLSWLEDAYSRPLFAADDFDP